MQQSKYVLHCIIYSLNQTENMAKKKCMSYSFHFSHYPFRLVNLFNFSRCKLYFERSEKLLRYRILKQRRKRIPLLLFLPLILREKTWYDNMVFRLLFYSLFYGNVHIEAINITWKPHTVSRFSSLYFQRELLKISL